MWRKRRRERQQVSQEHADRAAQADERVSDAVEQARKNAAKPGPKVEDRYAELIRLSLLRGWEDH